MYILYIYLYLYPYIPGPCLSFFPTCQVRVVRFYVRHFSSSSSSSSFLSFFFLLCNPVRSVFRAGPQRRVCEISVPRRTSTASLRDQCAAPDLNREFARSVFRAGPQPRVCEISVACRTSTASLRDQCCVPDLNRESARSVLRAGPHHSFSEIIVLLNIFPKCLDKNTPAHR